MSSRYLGDLRELNGHVLFGGGECVDLMWALGLGLQGVSTQSWKKGASVNALGNQVPTWWSSIMLRWWWCSGTCPFRVSMRCGRIEPMLTVAETVSLFRYREMREMRILPNTIVAIAAVCCGGASAFAGDMTAECPGVLKEGTLRPGPLCWAGRPCQCSSI